MIDAAELLKRVTKAIGEKPIRMKDLAVAVGLTSPNESVPSKVGARIRVQTGKLIADKKIVKLGARATTAYCTVGSHAANDAKAEATKAKAAATRAANKAKAQAKAPKKKAKATK